MTENDKTQSLQKIDPTTIGQAVDLWDALKQAAPQIAQADVGAPRERPLTQHPGLRQWLITEFALNIPDSLVVEKIDRMREDQMAAGDAPWPRLNKRKVAVLRRDLQEEWRPLRQQVEHSIVQVGVINKNRRLLALQSLAENLADVMFEERNDKTSQLYLIGEYRAVLNQIAQEMGELGMPVTGDGNALLEFAKGLVDVLKVQGMGLQGARDGAEVNDDAYYVEAADYREVDE